MLETPILSSTDHIPTEIFIDKPKSTPRKMDLKCNINLFSLWQNGVYRHYAANNKYTKHWLLSAYILDRFLLLVTDDLSQEGMSKENQIIGKEF